MLLSRCSALVALSQVALTWVPCTESEPSTDVSLEHRSPSLTGGGASFHLRRCLMQFLVRLILKSYDDIVARLRRRRAPIKVIPAPQTTPLIRRK